MRNSKARYCTLLRPKYCALDGTAHTRSRRPARPARHPRRTRPPARSPACRLACFSIGSQGKLRTIMTSGNETGPRMVFCVKLQQELPGLDAPPWPGPLGQRIYEQVSEEAWMMWE